MRVLREIGAGGGGPCHFGWSFWSFSVVVPTFFAAECVVPCLFWAAMGSGQLGVGGWLGPFWVRGWVLSPRSG